MSFTDNNLIKQRQLIEDYDRRQLNLDKHKFRRKKVPLPVSINPDICASSVNSNAMNSSNFNSNVQMESAVHDISSLPNNNIDISLNCELINMYKIHLLQSILTLWYVRVEFSLFLCDVGLCIRACLLVWLVFTSKNTIYNFLWRWHHHWSQLEKVWVLVMIISVSWFHVPNASLTRNWLGCFWFGLFLDCQMLNG